MNNSELIAKLREESDELIKHQFSHTKEAMSCLQRLHDLSLEAADALQEMERVPMTGDQIISATSRIDTQEYGWVLKIVRATEAHHGITPPESKG